MRDTQHELRWTMRELWELNKELQLAYSPREKPSKEKRVAFPPLAPLTYEEAQAVRAKAYQLLITPARERALRGLQSVKRFQRQYATRVVKTSSLSRGFPVGLSKGPQAA